METRIGDWYLCEGYIEEPVRVEALEADRVQVRYLTTGRIRWLGYPRIWLACKPHRLPYQVEFDRQERVVVLHAGEGRGRQRTAAAQPESAAGARLPAHSQATAHPPAAGKGIPTASGEAGRRHALA